MHTLFIEVDTESTWAVASLGPAFLAPYLRQHGHTTAFLRAQLGQSDADLVAAVRAEQPDLIGLSLTSRQWHRARDLMRAVRAEIDVLIVAGGLHPTFAPEAVLAEPEFDFVCLGEGETALLDLVNALETGDGDAVQGIDNIWAKHGPRPLMRTPYPVIDDLPFMDRGFLDEHQGVVHMATQRGCPFPCTYCAARMYNELYREQKQDYGRRRSHANVLEELFALRDAGKLAYVIFLDDTFTIHHPWVREFCKVYGEQLGTPFSLHARVETVNETMLHELAAAGCKHITYGVESGSERIRRDVMHRPVRNQRFRDVFRWTREAGIMVTANYMLGVPGETPADLQATLDLAEELDAADFGYFVFYPYPGTQLFRECREKGYLPDDFLQLPANHRTSVLRLPGLTQADIDAAYQGFTRLRERVYLERYGAAVPVPGSADESDTACGHVRDRARTG